MISYTDVGTFYHKRKNWCGPGRVPYNFLQKGTPSYFFRTASLLISYRYFCISLALFPFPELLGLPFFLIFVFMLFLYTINDIETGWEDSATQGN